MQLKKLGPKLGKLFREYRLKSGFSQGEICKILGYGSPQFLSNFERGLCMMPLKKLKKLIDLYDMNGEDVAELILNLQEAYIREELSLKKVKKSKRA